MKLIWLIEILFVVFFTACSNSRDEQSFNGYPSIYPDYTDIFVPVNIAPLNFRMTDSCSQMKVNITGIYGSLVETGKNKVSFPVSDFHELLDKHKGDTLRISVCAQKDDMWINYQPFFWFVTPEPVDSYLTYRLIEPAYEVYNKLSIRQRNLNNFDEKVLVDNNLTGNGCINCHITNKHRQQQSFFHLRHKQGGTVIANGKQLRKLDTRTSQTISAGVYGNWHPSGRYIVFSTNKIIPGFHSENDKRMEVYDTSSDLIVLDIDKNQVFSAPDISRPDKLESFPEFSADGKTLFFCVGDSVVLPEDYKQLKYSLCSIGFDPETRYLDHQVDTLFSSYIENKTVSLPKASPDGKYLMFTVFDYGTFPIWHSEARLYMTNLITGETNKLPIVNDNKYSNSYHSWSANSCWFVFASKRDNGMYGKPYFSYIKEDGNATKPFVLPQKDADFYDYCYESFNIPELMVHEAAFDAMDVEQVYENKEAEKMTFIELNGTN